ncbi:hypothetical protein SAMN06296427_107153 [Moheibacter sediminis]|uniref:Lipocalin-like domain-containing protein n=2 Tax=Moheibacter sediminis TaxID=1434700 RepID=A0A1W2BV15_9FLAO|nr:hypothetical protein SAMN06296427_107153 [Moheibacter sediminis]
MFFLLLTSAMMISCSEDDSPHINAALNKTWEMFSYGANIYDIPQINPGDIQWDINVHNHKLIITNNIEEQASYILPSGNYDIDITNNTVAISGITYNYTIENDTLIVSNKPELDGPIMKFVAK